MIQFHQMSLTIVIHIKADEIQTDYESEFTL